MFRPEIKPISWILLLAASLLGWYGVTTFLARWGPWPASFRPRAVRLLDLAEPRVPPAPPAAIAGGTFRLAVAPVVSPEKSLERYQELARYLAGKLHRIPVLLQRSSYAEVNNLVRYDQCDLALVCTNAFILGKRDFGMRAVAIPVIGGAITYHSCIMVPAASAAASLMELRGKRFVSADLMSTSGWLYPADWLRRRGGNPAAFFAEHLIAGSHDQAILAVATGKADGAAVDSLVLAQVLREDPRLREKVRVINQSPAFGMPPLVVSPRMAPALRRRLTALLFRLHDDPDGHAILALLGIQRFVRPHPSHYDRVRHYIRKTELP